MSHSRFTLLLLLILALAVAPVAPVLAMAAASAPGSAGLHGGHTAQHHDGVMQPSNGKFSTSCVQHNFCDGKCCDSCAQIFANVSFFLVGSEFIRQVLTPSVQHLSFSALISLRERPPRNLPL